MPRHPWMLVAAPTRSRLLLPVIAACLAASVALAWISADLNPAWYRVGILELELCWLTDGCQVLMAEWSSPEVALPGLYADYLYMAIYSATIGLACIQAAPLLSERWARLGVPLAWAQIVAASCDAIENVALIRLVGGATGPESAISFWFATAKFALIAIGLVYAAAGAVAHFRR